jgi:hypothetical protein
MVVSKGAEVMKIEINLKGEAEDKDVEVIKELLETVKKNFIWFKLNFNTEEMKQK